MRSVEKCYQGRNVRVFRLDSNGVLARLRDRARRLIEINPKVREVRLFGSLAEGDATPGSDADLFIVVSDGAGPFLERIPEIAEHFRGIGVGCDVIVYTVSERDALAASESAFSRVTLEEGILLAIAESRAATERESRAP